jgi:hypothetical protein
MSLRLLLSIGLVLVLARPVAAEPPFRVFTEDASANQCRSGVCTTIQVTRTTMSDGTVETLLFFSHNDEAGNPIPVVGVPSGFTPIPSESFVMNRRGTAAWLDYLELSVAWEDTDDFRGDSFSLEIERRKTADGSGQFTVTRLSERNHQLSADAKGSAGSVQAQVEGVEVLVALIIDTAAETAGIGDFGSASLIERKTVSRTRVK